MTTLRRKPELHYYRALNGDFVYLVGDSEMRITQAEILDYGMGSWLTKKWAQDQVDKFYRECTRGHRITPPSARVQRESRCWELVYARR